MTVPGDLRAVQGRVGCLPQDEQAAVVFAVVETLRPLADLGGADIVTVDLLRLIDDAQSAMKPQHPDRLRQVLAWAEAMSAMTASDEPPGGAAFALDVLACLIYAIKTVTEPEPALWSGYCVQRAYDCVFFADEALSRSGSPARFMQALDAWLDGDDGALLRQESRRVAMLPAQLRQLTE